MGKLYLKNLFIGIVIIFISSAISVIIFSVICLVNKSFNIITTYIVGGTIGFFSSYFLSRFFLRRYSYFSHQEISDNASNSIWIKRINEKRYIKKWNAYLSYLPCFVTFIGFIILAILIYPSLSDLSANNVWYSLIGIIIGASMISLPIYIIIGITSLQICKKCGAVNAFVYDETTDYEAISDVETKSETPSGNWRTFVKQSTRSYGSKNNGEIVKSGFVGNDPIYSQRSVDKITNTVVRHCDCCKDKTLIIEESVIKGRWKKS